MGLLSQGGKLGFLLTSYLYLIVLHSYTGCVIIMLLFQGFTKFYLFICLYFLLIILIALSHYVTRASLNLTMYSKLVFIVYKLQSSCLSNLTAGIIHAHYHIRLPSRILNISLSLPFHQNDHCNNIVTRAQENQQLHLLVRTGNPLFIQCKCISKCT